MSNTMVFNQYFAQYRQLLGSLIKEKESTTPGKIERKAAEYFQFIQQMVKIERGEPFQKEVEQSLLEICKTKPGRVLIKALKAYSSFIRIIEGEKNDFDGKNTIRLSFNGLKYLAVSDIQGIYQKRLCHALFHELLHVLHLHQKSLIKGLSTPNNRITNMTNVEEQATITGFNPYHMKKTLRKVDVLCENAFLLATQFPARIAHRVYFGDHEAIDNLQINDNLLNSYLNWLEEEIKQVMIVPNKNMDDIAFIIEFVFRNSLSIEYLCPEIWENEEFRIKVIKEALTQDLGDIVRAIPQRWINDEEYVKKVISLNPSFLFHWIERKDRTCSLDLENEARGIFNLVFDVD